MLSRNPEAAEGTPSQDSPQDPFEVTSKPLPEITLQDPEVSWAINAVVHKATDKDPEQRYGDALEFARAYHEAVGLHVETVSDISVIPAEVPKTKPFPLAELKNPYKGLRAFQAADERDFFGREAADLPRVSIPAKNI